MKRKMPIGNPLPSRSFFRRRNSNVRSEDVLYRIVERRVVFWRDASGAIVGGPMHSETFQDLKFSRGKRGL